MITCYSRVYTWDCGPGTALFISGPEKIPSSAPVVLESFLTEDNDKNFTFVKYITVK